MNRSIVLAAVAMLTLGSPTAASDVDSAQTEWIPFELHFDQHIFFRGTVNGHETDIVLDTGAEISIVDASFAQRIGIGKKKDVNLRGVGGQAKGYLAEDIALSSGNLSVRRTKAVVVDLSAFDAAIGRPMPFILGIDALTKVIIDIDYPNRRLAFRPRKDFDYEGSGNTVKLRRLKSARHAIEVSIEGRENGWYLVDTGSGHTAYIFPQFAKHQQLLDDRAQSSEWISGGVAGLVREATLSVRHFSLGGFSLDDVPVAVPLDENVVHTKEDFDGLLGNAVLSRFRIILDYRRGLMHIEPGAGWKTQKFSRNLIGLAAIPQGDGLSVIFVAPGSPADQAGWEKGMLVTTVNGKTGTGTELRMMLRKLSESDPGTRIVLLDENGVERAILMARYY